MEEPNYISSIGIPTRTRPASLNRCLTSILDNTQRFNREAELWVIDDSTDAPIQLANQEIIASHRANIRYVDRAIRANLAKTLAHKTGVPESVIQFALLGNNLHPDAYGAFRNTLLLLTAGQLTIQTDDDTECRITKSPNYKDQLTLSSANDPKEYVFVPGQEEALAPLVFETYDLLGIHEQLLGKRLQAITSESTPDFFDTSEHFLVRMQLPQARISSTFLGIAGDSGMEGHTFRLFQKNEAFERLIASEASFAEQMTTRWTRKGVDSPTISSGSFCMSTHMGLDNRQLLPPFMPVLRNEDGVWGAIRSTCFPHYFSGYLPFYIPHLPPEQRPGHAFRTSIRKRFVRTNDLMTQLIWHFYDARSGNLSLESLGNELVVLGQESDNRFWSRLRTISRATSKRIADFAERQLAERPHAPDFWREAVETYLLSIRTYNSREGVPTDLFSTNEKRIALLKHVVTSYGDLLMHWETLWDYCRVKETLPEK